MYHSTTERDDLSLRDPVIELQNGLLLFKIQILSKEQLIPCVYSALPPALCNPFSFSHLPLLAYVSLC